jgi:hypothetical protein
MTMTKQELINAIKDLINPDTTPEDLSDGEVLDMVYDLVESQGE